MPEQGIRSTYSQCPFKIEMLYESNLLSSATAFFYECDEEWFLITNGHNFTGRHFLTGDPLDSQRQGLGRFPSSIRAHWAQWVHPRASGAFSIEATELGLFAYGSPRWFEHPTLGPRCDVAALPIQRPPRIPEFMHNAANRISSMRIPIEPGVTVFIIGYPLGVGVGPGLPIWKSGYVASEPHYDITLSSPSPKQRAATLPGFFIDSLTRQGMSGSPVFARYTGAWDTTDPYSDLDFDDPGFYTRDDIVLSGQGTEFIGCYSGRVLDRQWETTKSVSGNEENQSSAALGLCWREDVMRLICRSRKLAADPHLD